MDFDGANVCGAVGSPHQMNIFHLFAYINLYILAFLQMLKEIDSVKAEFGLRVVEQAFAAKLCESAAQ